MIADACSAANRRVFRPKMLLKCLFKHTCHQTIMGKLSQILYILDKKQIKLITWSFDTQYWLELNKRKEIWVLDVVTTEVGAGVRQG